MLLLEGFRAPSSSSIFHPLILSVIWERWWNHLQTWPLILAALWGFTSCATQLGYQVCARFGLLHSPENFVLYHYEMTFFIPCRSPRSEVYFVRFQRNQPPSLLFVAVLTIILNSLLVSFPFVQHPIIFLGGGKQGEEYCFGFFWRVIFHLRNEFYWGIFIYHKIRQS